MDWYITPKEDDLMHYGVKGMKWRYKKGPTVKGATQYRRKTGADYGAEVGYEAAGLRNKFSPIKANQKAKTAKSGAKEGNGVVLNKGTVSPAKKKEIERVYRSYAKKYYDAMRTGKDGTAEAYKTLMRKYVNRLNNAEKKQLMLIVNRIGAKTYRLLS